MHRRKRWTALTLPACLILAWSALSAQAQQQPKVGAENTAVPQAAKGAQESNAAQAAKGSPKFICDKPIHDFGEVWSGEKIEHTFVFRNGGDADLEILNVRPGCGCTVAGQHDKRIAPGEEGKIPLALNTGRAGRAHDISKNISVTTNDPGNKTVTLTLRGKQKARIEVDPPTPFSWGRTNAETELTRTATITNNTDSPMKLELDPASKGPFEVSVKEIEEGKVAEVTVDASGPMQEGNVVTNLKFKTGVEEQKELLILCQLFKPPVVELKRKFLVLNALPTQDVPMVLPVEYNGEGTMKILEAKTSHPELKTEIKETSPGRIYQVTVVVPAGWSLDAGEQASLTLVTDVEGHETHDIPIRVIAPRISVAERLVGKKAPDVKVKDENGKEIEIGGEHTKQVTVLNFWASWCPHCKRQLPMVQQLYALYRGRGVEFINVSTDHLKPADEVKAAAEQLGVTMPLAFDPKSVAATPFGAAGPGSGLPTLFLIGKDGTVEAVHRGSSPTPELTKQKQETIAGEIDVLLEGKTRAAFASTGGPNGQLSAVNTGSTAVKGPSLEVDSMRQDVGRLKPGETREYNVYVRNTGTEELTIGAITPSNDLKVSEDYPKTLKPGEKGSITCTIQAGEGPGRFMHFVRIASNDASRPVSTVALAGETRPYLEVDPPTGVDFGDRVPTHTMPRMATVLYHGDDEIKYLEAESSSPKFEARVQTMGKGPHGMVIVEAKPPFEVGEHRGIITVKTNCPQQETVQIPVQLTQPPRIAVEPAIVHLQQTPRLQKTSVSITNNGQSPLHILGVESSSDRIRTQFYPEPDGRSYKLELTLEPNFATQANGEKITIRTDDEQMKEIVIPVRVTGRAGAVSSR